MLTHEDDYYFDLAARGGMHPSDSGDALDLRERMYHRRTLKYPTAKGDKTIEELASRIVRYLGFKLPDS